MNSESTGPGPGPDPGPAEQAGNPPPPHPTGQWAAVQPPGWTVPGPLGPGSPPPPAPLAGGWAPPPPAPRPGVIPLRPLALGEILDGAVTTMRRYWKVQLGITAAVMIVLTLFQAAVLLPGGQGAGGLSTSGTSDSTTGETVAGLLVGRGLTGLLAQLAQIVLEGALIVVVGRAVLGLQIDPVTAWRATKPHAWRLIGLSIVVLLITLGPVAVPVLLALALAAAGAPTGGWASIAVLGVLAAVPVAVWLWTRFAVSAPALVLESATIRTALRRSARLVRGSWWRVFGILLLNAVLTALLTGVLALPFMALGAAIASATGGSELAITAALMVGTAVAGVVVNPFSAGVVALLYIDLRMRREGLDLTLVRASAATAAAGRQ